MINLQYFGIFGSILLVVFLAGLLQFLFDKWTHRRKVRCVKPTGNVSMYYGNGGGIHPPYSRYYIRRTHVISTEKDI